MRLCVEQVSFGYNKKQTVLQNISFQAESGQLIALLGPNGSGKNDFGKMYQSYSDTERGTHHP